MLLEYDYKNTHSVLENEERLCFRVERFLASTAVLAAGCGGLDFLLSRLGRTSGYSISLGISCTPRFQRWARNFRRLRKKLQRTVRELMENSESLSGPNHMRYILALRYEERYAGFYSDPNAEEFRKSERLAAWLEEVNADLVSLWPEEARSLGQQGVLLPLDQFGEGSGLSGEFYSSVLDPYRANGTLYALPVGAKPLMLYFDADYFAGIGVVPPGQFLGTGTSW